VILGWESTENQTGQTNMPTMDDNIDEEMDVLARQLICCSPSRRHAQAFEEPANNA
jgi:hypothetical protein